MNRTPETRSCWSCKWQQIGGMTFLGFCTKPAKNNPTGKKDIPPHIVDAGCPLWQQKGVPQTAAEEKDAPDPDRF